jgi:hypothetical protein
MHFRFRFSIGQAMGLIAVSALVIANAIFVNQGSFTFHAVLVSGILLAGIGVLLYNRRLSRWMWIWIAGQTGSFLVMPLQAFLSRLFFDYNFVAITLSLYPVCSVVTVVGIAMTLRDIRRKLAIHENAPSSEAQRSTASTH